MHTSGTASAIALVKRLCVCLLHLVQSVLKASETFSVCAEHEIITLQRLQEVQAQAAAAKVKVAEADALDAAVQIMEDFQVKGRIFAVLSCLLEWSAPMLDRCHEVEPVN